MAIPHIYPRFWNIETDASGKPVPAAVRLAAHQVWRIVLREVRGRRGDETEAAEIIETAMLQASAYIEQLGPGRAVQNMPGLVLTISRRLLRRRARKWRRFERLEGGNQPGLRVANWEDQANGAILLRELVSGLSKEGVRIVALRLRECNWQAIARVLNSTVPAVKNRFWREVENLRMKITQPRAKN